MRNIKLKLKNEFRNTQIKTNFILNIGKEILENLVVDQT